MSVNETQVGGTHYQTKDQCWDFIIENGLGFLEGSVLKYITRARKKHASPVEDYKKALHYVDKMLEVEELRQGFFTRLWEKLAGNLVEKYHRSPEFASRLSQYMIANHLCLQEETFLTALLLERHYLCARTLLTFLVKDLSQNN